VHKAAIYTIYHNGGGILVCSHIISINIRNFYFGRTYGWEFDIWSRFKTYARAIENRTIDGIGYPVEIICERNVRVAI
jgi:hypothetical protein